MGQSGHASPALGSLGYVVHHRTSGNPARGSTPSPPYCFSHLLLKFRIAAFREPLNTTVAQQGTGASGFSYDFPTEILPTVPTAPANGRYLLNDERYPTTRLQGPGAVPVRWNGKKDSGPRVGGATTQICCCCLPTPEFLDPTEAFPSGGPGPGTGQRCAPPLRSAAIASLPPLRGRIWAELYL